MRRTESPLFAPVGDAVRQSVGKPVRCGEAVALGGFPRQRVAGVPSVVGTGAGFPRQSVVGVPKGLSKEVSSLVYKPRPIEAIAARLKR